MENCEPQIKQTNDSSLSWTEDYNYLPYIEMRLISQKAKQTVLKWIKDIQFNFYDIFKIPLRLSWAYPKEKDR